MLPLASVCEGHVEHARTTAPSVNVGHTEMKTGSPNEDAGNPSSML